MFARGDWVSLVPPAALTAADAADSARLVAQDAENPWPGPRSVCGLELVTGSQGREYLVCLLGERAPSADGHAAAGAFWADAWAYQVPPQGYTAASLTDAVFHAVGRRTGEGRWAPVATGPYDDEDDADVDGPGPRGWFASAPMGDLEEGAIVLFGGVDETNRRLGDGWIFRLG